jgi:co-chaperonin GroES (HSP10)
MLKETDPSMNTTEISFVPAKKLKENKKNPRKIDPAQFQKLCTNMQNDPDFFTMRPCLVNETKEGFIVYAGNQRFKAAKKIGIKEIPCIVTKDTPEDLIKKRIVLDNLHHGEHDFDMLTDLYDVDELLELGMTLDDLEMPEEIEEIPSEEDDEGKLYKIKRNGKKLQQRNLKMILPLNNKIIVSIPPESEKKINGIIVPSSPNPQDALTKAQVVNSGNSEILNDGDFVLFPFYAGILYQDNLKFLDEKDLFAVIVKDSLDEEE